MPLAWDETIQYFYTQCKNLEYSSAKYSWSLCSKPCIMLIIADNIKYIENTIFFNFFLLQIKVFLVEIHTVIIKSHFHTRLHY